jgi:hypothetical protein
MAGQARHDNYFSDSPNRKIDFLDTLLKKCSLTYWFTRNYRVENGELKENSPLSILHSQLNSYLCNRILKT